jgi:hypothetical protein
MKTSLYAGASAIAAILALIAVCVGAARAGDLRSSAQTLGLIEQHNLTVPHSTVATPTVTAPQSFITTHPAAGKSVVTVSMSNFGPIVLPPNNPIWATASGAKRNPNDPCFPGICREFSHLESEIAFYSQPGAIPVITHNHLLGCNNGVCQGLIGYPDGFGNEKYFTIKYANGRPLPGEMDRFLATMRSADAVNHGGGTRGPLHE